MISLKMYRGDDKNYELKVTDKQTGNAVDITGCIITWTWKEKITDTVPFLQKDFTPTDPTNGVAEVEIIATDTNSLTAKSTFIWDIYILKTTGKGETLLKGKMTVYLDVNV